MRDFMKNIKMKKAYSTKNIGITTSTYGKTGSVKKAKSASVKRKKGKKAFTISRKGP